MRISYNWLKDYIDLKISPERLAEVLTLVGFPIEAIEKKKKKGDYIFEIEVTANRPDCLSVIGIARELTAITGRKLKVPLSVSKRHTTYDIRHTISIKVEDKRLCPRYTGRVIKNVNINESPQWLKSKLEAMGLRPVNNVVDITNFCLFETGEPLHAFDLDKIAGATIIIRRAKKGERIITIDGVERILTEADLVIADRDRPIAIAGVIGGVNTEVTASTKNILLEAAYFDPISVRRSARCLGVSTESSYRFERKVDSENIAHSSNRALGLIIKTAGGEAGEFIDIGKIGKAKNRVELRPSRCSKILGERIAPAKIKKIVNSLGLKTVSSSNDKIRFTVPSFRQDLKDEIDLIEEVARIYGYDKIDETIPRVVKQPVRESFERAVDKKIRRILTGLGFDEIITYSLLSKNILDMTGMLSEEVVEIKNPLSSEQEVMRPSLASGMLSAIAWNKNRKAKDLKLFELGSIYLKDRGLFTEKKHLSIALTGENFAGWQGSSREFSFFDLKGVAEELMTELGVCPQSFKPATDARFSSGETASVKIKEEDVGAIGEVRPNTLNNFDIKDRVFYLELDIDRLYKYTKLEKKFRELTKYPAVFRDISIIVDKDSSNAEIASSIETATGDVLKNIELIDRYSGSQIPNGKVGLTYRLEYQDLTRTLEEKEVSELQARVLRSLEEKFGAQLR